MGKDGDGERRPWEKREGGGGGAEGGKGGGGLSLCVLKTCFFL